MRRRARVDRNHPEIVRALLAVGCSVVSLAQVGGGVPDLLVGRGRRNLLLEVKDARGKLTPDQVEFAARWWGELAVVRTVQEALAAVGCVTALPTAPTRVCSESRAMPIVDPERFLEVVSDKKRPH